MNIKKHKKNSLVVKAIIVSILSLVLVGASLPEALAAGEISSDITKIGKIEGEVPKKVQSTKVLDIQLNMDDYATIEDLPFDALDEEGDLDGFTRMTHNIPVEFPTRLDNGRKYYLYFGALLNTRKVNDTEEQVNTSPSTGEITARLDHAYIPLPEKGSSTSFINNLSGTDDGVQMQPNKADPGVPLLGSQVAIKPADNQTTERSWATYAFSAGRGMGSPNSGYVLGFGLPKAPDGKRSPMIVKMYQKEGAGEIYAYGVQFNQDTRVIDGFYRIHLEPVGRRGRISTTTKFLSTLQETTDIAQAYGIHIDIQTQHQTSKVYSLGDFDGFYLQRCKKST